MNKRVFLSIMMAIAISFSANAQNDGGSKFHFGLKASPSYNWMKTDGTGLESDGGSIGLSYGLMTEFAISKNYAFATGLEITYRGGKYKYNSDSSYKQMLQYVEVPIGLKLKTNEIGYIKYYGLFGILPGFLVKAKEDIIIIVLQKKTLKTMATNRIFTLSMCI